MKQFIFLFAILFSFPVIAGDFSRTYITNNYYSTKEITSGISSRDLAEGIAIAAACSGNFHATTTRLQGRIDWAAYDDKHTFCFQGAIRPGESTDVMVDFGLVPDDDPDKVLYRAGILMVF